MSEARRNLWPDAINVTAIIPPVVILREQAALLAERTKGLVRGEIESRTEPVDEVEEYLHQAISPEELFTHVHTMYLVAPALDNYQYALLSVRHDFQPYPCAARFHPLPSTPPREGRLAQLTTERENPAGVQGEEAFVDWLREVLSRHETTRIIQALIYRIQGIGDTQDQG